MKNRIATLDRAEMPCKFCKNSAQYSPLAEMEDHGVRVYFCDVCQAEYLYWSDGAILSTSLYTTINNKVYRWSMSSNSHTILWLVVDPGQPGIRRNKNLQVIKDFTNQADIINITPQNIVEKLKTYLVFL